MRVIGLSIIGSNIDTNSYVGASGNAYTIGIAQANFEWIGAIPAMILASLIFIPLYWRAGVYSIPEYLALLQPICACSDRIDHQPVRSLCHGRSNVGVGSGIRNVSWLANMDEYSRIRRGCWLIFYYRRTRSGGFHGRLTGEHYVHLRSYHRGIGHLRIRGFTNFAAELTKDNPDHLSVYLPADHPQSPWPGVILGLGIVLSPAYWIASQAILQRALGAKSQWDASASMMFAAFAKTFVPLLIIFPGLLALVLNAPIDEADKALPWVIKNVLPPGLSGLMFVAVIAALQSSLDSSINATSLMVTRDIRHVLIKQHDPERDLVVGRWISLVLLVSAMAIAPFISDLGGIFMFCRPVCPCSKDQCWHCC